MSINLTSNRMTFYDNHHGVQNESVVNGSGGSVGGPHEVEALKQQLEKEKQMNKKLMSNIKKIKKKMIDVSALIELHDGLKKRIEEQNGELQKFYQQNQILLTENANLKKNAPPPPKQSNDSSEQLAQLQKLRFEKIELENKVKTLKEKIERVNSEKDTMKKQFETEEKKWKKQEATQQQVEELRSKFALAQKELTELRSKKGFMSYADFAIVKPTVSEEKEKKICKSVAVNTEASLLERYIAQKYPSRAVSTPISKPKEVVIPASSQNDDDDEFEPLGSMDTSIDIITPPQLPSKPLLLPKPTLPLQPVTVTTTTTTLKRKNEEKEKEKQLERKLKKMKKPTSEEFEEVLPSSKPVSTPSIIQMPSPSHISIVEKRINKDAVEKSREEMPPPKTVPTTVASSNNELSTPQLPPIFFEKLENQTVEIYIENIFINFICKFEPFFSETKHQSSLLGDVNRACKKIWTNYPKQTNEIANGILTIIAKLIASKASCEKWGLCIILLDHMDIYSFSNQLLETIFANLYITITSFITGIESSDQSFKKLMALLAGISTISNAKFARPDFCMFSRVKEIFYYILQYSLQNTRNQFGMIKYSNFQLLLAMLTSNRRLITNGFDTYSPLDLAIYFTFCSMQSKLSSSQNLLDAENTKAIGDIEKLKDLYKLKDQTNLTPPSLSQTIIESIHTGTDEKSIAQASNALGLLTCLVDDWNFTFNTVILNGLWSLVLKYLNDGNSKLIAVLSIISKLAIYRSQQIPLENKSNQNEWDSLEIYHDGLGDLLEKFNSILLLENVFSMEASKLVADTMIEIVVNKLALSKLLPYQEKQEYFIQTLKVHLDTAKDWIQKHMVESDLFKIINVV
ncbi:hypothetical protein NAEGRDRAFT_78254 [Naegleria gruberi]|uniref:Uncharacterized protein n=1 Tax=Naegleria gruberi TaxID=5762 RepID=D2V286_NAEGR|nr:uncharacterized protein NAEGRDRAFT_78254 [Naegleria gruberi]EFC48858.1 hypothetical protein NAEGRDRAFT_78254 [Naegleria gruberi]|eukprot:XP_002681602.1 hypothetical protein NAEGRDRAFT_78254 [Naegleria gruberi strain NEG-M]